MTTLEMQAGQQDVVQADVEQVRFSEQARSFFRQVGCVVERVLDKSAVLLPRGPEEFPNAGSEHFGHAQKRNDLRYDGDARG